SSKPLHLHSHARYRVPHSFPTRRSSDLHREDPVRGLRRKGLEAALGIVHATEYEDSHQPVEDLPHRFPVPGNDGEDLQPAGANRSEEHTSELQSRSDLVCRLLLEKKKKK